jgi:hypothetical protein
LNGNELAREHEVGHVARSTVIIPLAIRLQAKVGKALLQDSYGRIFFKYDVV